MAHTIAGMFQVPDDGDDYDAASVNVPFEWLAYRRSRQVASIAELKAIAEADRADGDVVTVVSGGVALGAYTFSTTFASTPLVLGFTETPDVGAGTWVSNLYWTHGLDDQLSGFAAIDTATIKLARPDVVPYRLAGIGTFCESADPPAAAQRGAVTNMILWHPFNHVPTAGFVSVVLPEVFVGDLIEVSATFRALAEVEDGSVGVRFEIGGNDWIVDGAMTMVPSAAAAAAQYTITGVHTVTMDSGILPVSATLVGKFVVGGATTVIRIYDAISLIAKVIRP
jgi:hypothetical protein